MGADRRFQLFLLHSSIAGLGHRPRKAVCSRAGLQCHAPMFAPLIGHIQGRLFVDAAVDRTADGLRKSRLRFGIRRNFDHGPYLGNREMSAPFQPIQRRTAKTGSTRQGDLLIEPRLIIAYVLIVILAIAGLSLAAWTYHNIPSRKDARRRRQGEEARMKRSMELKAKKDNANS